MDRLFLSDWGRSLSDDDFARALAGLGTIAGVPLAWADNHAYSRRDVGTRLRWEVPSRDVKALPSSEDALQAWHRVRDRYQTVALFLDRDDALRPSERMAVARALSPLPEVQGVTIESDDSWAQSLAWRLPYSLSTLPGDAIAPVLLDVGSKQPPSWPTRFATADRQSDRHTILVVSGTLSQLADRELELPPRLKCHLLVANGLGTTGADQADALLDRLAGRFAASGIAFSTKPLEQRAFAECVIQLSFELSHDLPLDAALKISFANEATLVANASLLRESRTSAQVPRMLARARAMPQAAPLDLSPRSLDGLTRGMVNLGVGGLDVSSGAPSGDTVSIPAKAVSEILESTAHQFDYAGESHEASAITEVQEAVRKAASTNATATARYVQQRSFRCDASGCEHEIEDAYVVGEAVSLRVRIGPLSSKWKSSDIAFPDAELPPNETTHRLTLMFHEFAQLDAPLLRDVILPRVGTSEEATFEFTPRKAGAFEGRISVIHRGRILQTALLRTCVLAVRDGDATQYRIEMNDEARVRQDWTSLDRRPRFDLAIVCNRDAEATPGMTATGGGHAWATDLSGIKGAVNQINSLLSEVAKSTADYGDGLDKGENPNLLVALAYEGRELYAKLVADQLAKNTDGGLDVRSEDVTHIQIVGTRVDEIVPIEFIYDYELPADGLDPTLCPNFREALEHGNCQGACPGQVSPGRHVCPMGFWGVRKVIERHLFDSAAANSAEGPLVVRSEPSDLRASLGIRKGAVVAHSDRIEPASLSGLLAKLEEHVSGTVAQADSWDAWAQAVVNQSPEFMIAFPHNDGAGAMRTLEVNSTKLRTTALPIFGDPHLVGAPVKWYARAPNGRPPLVFLLGCDTAGTAEEFGSHVNSFRRTGAAIVLSTIATVFGEHAVAVGTAIVDELMQSAARGASSPGTATTLGDILREAKRKALLKSQPMALCVVAFGDADWRLQ